MRTCLIILSVLLFSSCSGSKEVVILTGNQPSPTIHFAANELATLLGEIYPDTQFSIREKERGNGKTILLTTDIGTGSWITPLPEQVYGAFSVSNQGSIACIYGYDEPGVLQGVYKLLEKLGFHKEGVLRRAWFRDGDWCDIIIYGLLREEWVS